MTEPRTDAARYSGRLPNGGDAGATPAARGGAAPHRLASASAESTRRSASADRAAMRGLAGPAPGDRVELSGNTYAVAEDYRGVGVAAVGAAPDWQRRARSQIS